MVPQKDLFQLSRLVLNSGIKVRLLAIALASIWILAACTPRVESGAVLFEDDFEVAGSGWPEQSDVEAITGYEDGAYAIDVHVSQLTVWASAGKDFSDVIIETNARTAAGPEDNGFGVICRYQDDDNFYFMLVSADGFYGIGTVVEREARFIHGEADIMDYSASLPTDYETLDIRATCVGDRLTLAINAEELATATATDFQTGDVGLIARSFLEPGVEVRFDNFKVTQP